MLFSDIYLDFSFCDEYRCLNEPGAKAIGTGDRRPGNQAKSVLCSRPCKRENFHNIKNFRFDHFMKNGSLAASLKFI